VLHESQNVHLQEWHATRIGYYRQHSEELGVYKKAFYKNKELQGGVLQGQDTTGMPFQYEVWCLLDENDFIFPPLLRNSGWQTPYYRVAHVPNLSLQRSHLYCGSIAWNFLHLCKDRPSNGFRSACVLQCVAVCVTVCCTS